MKPPGIVRANPWAFGLGLGWLVLVVAPVCFFLAMDLGAKVEGAQDDREDLKACIRNPGCDWQRLERQQELDSSYTPLDSLKIMGFVAGAAATSFGAGRLGFALDTRRATEAVP